MAAQVGSLAAYLEGRWKLEEDYAQRLRSLCSDLAAAAAASAGRGEEEENELLRVFGSLFGVVVSAKRNSLLWSRDSLLQLLFVTDVSCETLSNETLLSGHLRDRLQHTKAALLL